MQLNDVEEVITASNPTIANDLLSKGWTLLAVVGGRWWTGFCARTSQRQRPTAG